MFVTDGKDLSECAFPAELEKYIIPVHTFDEELPGENIFPDHCFDSSVSTVYIIKIITSLITYINYYTYS